MVLKSGRHKFIVSLLVSYFLILAIPILVGFLVHHEALKVVKQDIKEYNLAALEQAMNITDGRMEDIRNMVFQLTLNPKIKYFIYLDRPLGSNAYYRMWEVLKDVNPYSLTNDFIIDFAIYLQKSDIVISANSINNLRSFYDSYFKHDSSAFSYWTQNMLGKHYDGVLMPSVPAIINGKEYEVINYVQTIPVGYPNQFDGFIMILIDRSKINEILRRTITGDKGFIYIMDQHGNFLTGVSKGDINIMPTQVDISKKRGFVEKYINGQWITMCYITSDYNGWVYVAATPSSVVMNKVNYIKNIILGVTIFSLVTGLLTAYILARKNTRPLKGIVELLKEFFEYDTNEEVHNEYSFLEGSITELIKSNRHLQQAMCKQKPVLETVFFNRLLNGEFSSKDEIEAFQSSMGFQIDGDFFVVLLVRIRGYEEATNHDFLKELDGSRVIVKETIKTYLGDGGYCHFVDRDKIAILISDKYESISHIEIKIEDIANSICYKVKEQYNILISFYVGSVYTDLEDVYLSFDEAKWVLDYQYDKNMERSVVWYNQIPKVNEQYSYSVDLEIRLMNLVKAGKKQELEKLLKSIYLQNFVRRMLTSDMKSQLMFEMRGTIIKLSEQLDLYELLHHKIRSIDCNGNADKFYELIMEIYTELCDMVNQRKTSNALKLKEKIINHIHNSFADSNLSLTSIAFELDITEQYLSQFFKRQTGQNFSAYLEKVRIDRACDLLRDNSLSINDISCKVGYNSDKTFRRAFKRVKGVSPTSFRNHLMKDI